MRSEEEIRKQLDKVQKNILKYWHKANNLKDLNRECFRMDVDFYNGGEFYLAWALNDKGEK
jgi:hypothetical protein